MKDIFEKIIPAVAGCHLKLVFNLYSKNNFPESSGTFQKFYKFTTT